MKNLTLKLLVVVLLGVLSLPSFAQEKKEKNIGFRLQFDSRRTFVDREAVGIFGIRSGLQYKNKFELGVGFYGSRIFEFLGKEVEKDYKDKSFDPPEPIPSKVRFDYASVYGEYTVLNNSKWRLTANSQFGIGRVNIFLTDGSERRIREGKTLLEHSFKARHHTRPWLDLIGGLGYRYLLVGERQIKDAFNAPIYIISADIDFKRLFKGKKME